MSGDNPLDGHTPDDSSGEPAVPAGLTELAALAQVSSQSLDPIPGNVLPEIRDFAETLRVLFGALGVSLNRLAALLHSDPGTVSRYLSGRRVPPPGFIDGLCKAIYDVKGSLITPQVQDLVHERFLAALQAHNPARYEVQRLTDLLQEAAQDKRQHEITVAALEEAIASRNDKIYALELEGRQLRSTWVGAEGLLGEEREQLQRTIEVLREEVRYFQGQLLSAQRRATAAEDRCRELEAQLDSAGALLPDEDQTAEPHPEPVPEDWADVTLGLPDGRLYQSVNPLLQRIAQRQIEQVNSFTRQMPFASEITYDGEDRDWLLSLTREAEHSIDSISLSTVDAGVLGLDGGLWTSDLGIRHMELEHGAVARNVQIRRIFVSEREDMFRDESFVRIMQMQRDIGVLVRIIDHRLIPTWLQSMISNFTIFDNAVVYERVPATSFTVRQPLPATIRTMLSSTPAKTRDLQKQFAQLWSAADPERPIDE